MYLQDCYVQVKIYKCNRIFLPKVLEAYSRLDFMLYTDTDINHSFLVPILVMSDFHKQNKKAKLLAKVPQDKFGRIRIPSRLMKFMPDRNNVTFEVRNDIIEITNNTI